MLPCHISIERTCNWHGPAVHHSISLGSRKCISKVRVSKVVFSFRDEVGWGWDGPIFVGVWLGDKQSEGQIFQ